jgi:hypothetical protein
MNLRKPHNPVFIVGLSLLLFSCSPQYLARYAFWGPPDTKDFERFSQRIINNALPVFDFKRDREKENRFIFLFKTIEYKRNGKTEVAHFEEFLKSTGTTVFIVIKDDILLCERYFNGYSRESVFTSFSITKSFISALIGIALSEGYIIRVLASLLPIIFPS